MEYNNVVILIGIITLITGAFMWWVARPSTDSQIEAEKRWMENHINEEMQTAPDESRIIVVEDEKKAPTMHLHDAVREIRAAQLGGTPEDTLKHEYVEELDTILTRDAIDLGAKLYLEWVLTNPQHVAQVATFVDNGNWNLVRAMLEETIADVLDQDAVIIYLKSRQEKK